MTDLPFGITTYRDKPLSSQGTRPFSWASVSKTMQVVQSVHVKLYDTPITVRDSRTSSRGSQRDQNMKRHTIKFVEKDASKSYSKGNISHPKAGEQGRYNPNNTTLRITQPKIQGSLPNLLMLQVKNENSTNPAVAESFRERPATSQKKRVSDQIALSFKFKPGHQTQTPGLGSALYSSREKLMTADEDEMHIDPQIQSSRAERMTYDSSRRTHDNILVANERRSATPGNFSLRVIDSGENRKSNNDKIYTLKGLDRLNEQSYSQNVIKDERRMSQNSSIIRITKTQNSTRDGKRTTQSISSFKDIAGSQQKKKQRPQTTDKNRKSKVGLFDSKVSEQERERLAMFLKDDFVNELIFNKYYQVLDDVEKMSAINALKRKMDDHKVIREKYNEHIKQVDPNFFEQFNQARKDFWKGDGSPSNRSPTNKSLIRSSTKTARDITTAPQTQRPKAYSVFSPRDSPTMHVRNKVSSDSMGESNFLKPEKVKDFDYYMNLELAKSASLEATKKKKKRVKGKGLMRLETVDIERDRFARIRKSLKEKLLKCVQMKLTREEMMNDLKIFPTKAFEKQGSYAFMKAAKYGDYMTITQYLDQDRFYILEYDAIRQTALHWAAKRGQFEVCKILIENGADVDAVDLGGRTPLYYALRDGNPEVVRLLLRARANPWSVRGHNYKECCQDEKCLRYLSKARQLSLLLAFFPVRERNLLWDREIEVFLGYISDDDLAKFYSTSRKSVHL